MAEGSTDKIEIDAVPLDPRRTDPNRYKRYIEYMPAELKYDNFHILLLFSSQDRNKVIEFQKRIQRDCVVIVGRNRWHPIVKREDEIVGDPVYILDQAAERALYVFLFVTKAFCEEHSLIYKSYAFLIDALEERKWSVIPVYTENKETRRKRGYRLPIMLNALQAISYWDTTFYREAVQRLLEAKVGEFEKMNLDLESKRKKYFYHNKEDLKKIKCVCTRRLKQPQRFNSPDVTPGIKQQEQDSRPQSAINIMQEKDCKPQSSKMQAHDSKPQGTIMQSQESETRRTLIQDQESKPPCCKPVGTGQFENERKMEHSSQGYTDLKSNPNDIKPQIDRVCDSGKNSECLGASTKQTACDLPNHAFNQNLSNAFKHISMDSNPSPENSSQRRVFCDGRSDPPSHETEQGSYYSPGGQPAFSSPNLDSGVSTAVNPPSSFSSPESRQKPGSGNWSQRIFSSSDDVESTQPKETWSTSHTENASNTSETAASGSTIVHHHHHHHEHISIENVKFMVVGKKGKIDVRTDGSIGSDGESDDFDADAEQTEAKSAADTSGLDSQKSEDTDLKKPHASNPGSAKPTTQSTPTEGEETFLKTVEKPEPPPTYQMAMGLSEMTDPYRSNLLETHSKF